ncbi:type II secretion system protein GspL [Roseateles sp. GG27B]
MSTLLLFLPARNRLRAQGRSTQTAEGLRGLAVVVAEVTHKFAYLLTADGMTISAEGMRSAAQLPHADNVIAIPAEADVSWQRVTLPRAGRQMRSALVGMLEETLLDDPEGLHFAIEPETAGGDKAWVAVTARAWLLQHLTQLEAAQVFVDRVVPLAWPDAPPRGYFYDTGNPASPIGLRWSHPEGVTNLPLEGNLSRQLFPPTLVQNTQWSAAAAVAEQAELWLGTAVTVLSPAQRALAVLDSPWNFRQFELAPRTRGIRAVRDLYRGLMRRNWRPVRYGLAGLAVVQVLGLNLYAWQLNQQLQTRRAALNQTLTSSFPQVRAILDAPVQMQRETDSLRASAGKTSEQDLESMLAAAATAWPAERGPVDALSFETGRLVLSGAGWSDAQIQQFRSQLRSEGWQLDVSEGRLTLSRAPRLLASNGR